MSQNEYQFTEQEKKKIYDLLYDDYMKGIADYGLKGSERKIISQKIVNNVEKAKNIEEINAFLVDLANLYHFFKHSSMHTKEIIDNKKKDEVISKLRSFISNYSG